MYLGEDEILLQRVSPTTASVFRAIWERENVVFDLSIARSPSLGLSSQQITDIVAAIIAQQ